MQICNLYEMILAKKIYRQAQAQALAGYDWLR
jgi:hypothetical protein